jgi:hypothetical protein
MHELSPGMADSNPTLTGSFRAPPEGKAEIQPSENFNKVRTNTFLHEFHSSSIAMRGNLFG